jgi:hypothetical protein
MLRESLPEKDRQRLSIWEGQQAMAEFAGRETERFHADFDRALTKERAHLLLKNHVERMALISSGMARWIDLNRDILSGDLKGAIAIAERIQGHQDQIDQVKALIHSSLTGALVTEKKRLRADVDGFFSRRPGKVVGDTLAFVRSYSVSYQRFEEYLESAGFTHTLYLVFQAFRQDLDAYVAENVNPAIIRFAKEEEEKIVAFLIGAVNPYHVMVRNVLSGYDGMMKEIEKTDGSDGGGLSERPDLTAIKQRLGLSLPPMAASLHYSALIKTDAALRLGVYSAAGFIKRLFRKTGKSHKEEKILALQDGVKRMKRETERALAFHFKNYRENLKFQFVLKLADAVSKSIYDTLVARFQIYATDLTSLMGLMDRQGEEREGALAKLADMAGRNDALNGRIERVRRAIRDSNAGDGIAQSASGKAQRVSGIGQSAERIGQKH